MIPILNSDSQEPSNLLKESKRTAGQNNTKWLQESIEYNNWYILLNVVEWDNWLYLQINDYAWKNRN